MVNKALLLTDVPPAEKIDIESISLTAMDAVREFNESTNDVIKQKIAIRKAIELIDDKAMLIDLREYALDYGLEGIFDLDSFETLYLIRRLARLI